MREQFQQVIDAYNSLPCKPMKISRKRHDFVQLWADNWPLKPTKTIEGAVHYEFLDMGEEITIEIHLEASAVGKRSRPLLGIPANL